MHDPFHNTGCRAGLSLFLLKPTLTSLGSGGAGRNIYHGSELVGSVFKFHWTIRIQIYDHASVPVGSGNNIHRMIFRTQIWNQSVSAVVIDWYSFSNVGQHALFFIFKFLDIIVMMLTLLLLLPTAIKLIRTVITMRIVHGTQSCATTCYVAAVDGVSRETTARPPPPWFPLRGSCRSWCHVFLWCQIKWTGGPSFY